MYIKNTKLIIITGLLLLNLNILPAALPAYGQEQDVELQRAIELSLRAQQRPVRHDAEEKESTELDEAIARSLAEQERQSQIQMARRARHSHHEHRHRHNHQQPARAIGIQAPNYGDRLPLPASLAHKKVYHLQTKQIDGWSCGYNCLYNACRLEQQVSGNNIYHNLHLFNNRCLPTVQANGLNPMASSTLEDIQALSGLLDLQYTDILSVENNQSNFFIRLFYKHHDNGSSDKARQRRVLIEKYSNILRTSAGKMVKIHFMCHIPGHALLMTVVQRVDGSRSLYIQDNLNDAIYEGSQTKMHIDFICRNFGI